MSEALFTWTSGFENINVDTASNRRRPSVVAPPRPAHRPRTGVARATAALSPAFRTLATSPLGVTRIRTPLRRSMYTRLWTVVSRFPHQSHFSELPSHTRSKEIGRATVAVEVTRT